MSYKNGYVVLSATKISTYLQCKWKYWCNYVLHLPKKPNPAFKLGIACHESLRLAGEIWREKEEFTKHDITKIKNRYNEVAAQEGIQNMFVYDEGLKMVMARVKDFDLGKIIDIEHNFRLTTDEGVTLIGAMDKVVELSEETVLVVDYKTSKYFYTKDELKADIQLSVYDLVASMKYPQYNRIILSLDYLRGEPVYTSRTRSERSAFAKYIAELNKQMIGLEEVDAKPAINDMCNWCDFTSDCPAYQDALVNDMQFKKNFNDLSSDELVEEYLKIKSRKRILDEQERRIRTYVMDKIERDGVNVAGEGVELYIRQNKKVQYNPQTLAKVMSKDDLVKVMSPIKSKVDDYLSDRPVERSQVMSNNGVETEYTNPFLASKKVSKSR